MDKLYKDGKKTDSPPEKIEKNGIFTILLTLAIIASSLFFLNLSISFSERENEGASAISEAILAISERLEENEAVAAFLGLDNDGLDYDEKEIY